jgi:hypothetical protein
VGPTKLSSGNMDRVSPRTKFPSSSQTVDNANIWLRGMRFGAGMRSEREKGYTYLVIGSHTLDAQEENELLLDSLE